LDIVPLKKSKKVTARSIWKQEEKEKITQRVRQLAGDNALRTGDQKYLAHYQAAQSQLWEELSNDEKEKWSEKAYKQNSRQKTPQEKSK
jgi:hypothetical protein